MSEVKQRRAEYKITSTHLGGHVHLSVWSRWIGSATWARLGALTLAEDEIETWKRNCSIPWTEIKDERTEK